MIYRVVHETAYQYEEPAATCHNQVHLTPRDLTHQRCLRSRIVVEPTPRAIDKYIDYFDNIVSDFEIVEPHDRLIIKVTSSVEVTNHAEVDLPASQAWETVRDRSAKGRDPATIEAYQFVFPSRYVQRDAAFVDYVKPSFTAGRPILDAVMDLTTRIHTEFHYDPGSTDIATSIHDVLQNRHGVCQDFAHVQLACLRSLGLPARYVSGYLRTDPPPGKPRVVGADASHAWIEAYDPEQGWVGFDPTNNCIVNSRHIIVALGRDFADVSPIKGVVLGGGSHELKVKVDVLPVQQVSEASNAR